MLFDPSRFERGEPHTSIFGFAPFGAPPHNCVGEELSRTLLKILTIRLLTQSRWNLPKQNFKPDFSKFHPAPKKLRVQNFRLI